MGAAITGVAAVITGDGGTIASPIRVNIKAGTYANTTTSRTFASVGTTTSPIWWRGYQTTIGDQDGNNVATSGTGNQIPLITFSTGRFLPSGNHQIFSNLDVTGAATNGTALTSGTHLSFYRCRFTNTNAASGAFAMATSAASLSCVACYFKATASSTAGIVNIGAGTNSFLGCYFTGGAAGIVQAGNATNVLFCIFDSVAGDAISMSAGSGNILNSSFYGTTLGGTITPGNAVNVTGTLGALLIVANNYFEGWATAAKAAIMNSSGTNTNLIRPIANTYYNCTLNTSGLGDAPLIFDNGSLGSAGFVLPGSQNFALNSVAKALGFPGLFENTSVYQGYLDPGAVQRQEPAGGGMLVNPRKTGGKQ